MTPDSDNPFPGLTADQARRWAAVQPADGGYPAGPVGDDPERARLIDGFRALADYLAAHPAVPAPPYGLVVLVHAQGTDSEMQAQVDLVGETLGTRPDEDADSGQYAVRRPFGPVTYKFLAISEERMARHRAWASYVGSVDPGVPPAQPSRLAAAAFPAGPAAEVPADAHGSDRSGEDARRVTRRAAR